MISVIPSCRCSAHTELQYRQLPTDKGKPLERVGRKATGLRSRDREYGRRATGRSQHLHRAVLPARLSKKWRCCHVDSKPPSHHRSPPVTPHRISILPFICRCHSRSSQRRWMMDFFVPSNAPFVLLGYFIVVRFFLKTQWRRRRHRDRMFTSLPIEMQVGLRRK